LYQKVRGTQDILPGESEKWQKIEDEIKKICRLYNLNEIRTPVIEHTEVFIRSIGEETDIVSKEMYSLTTKGEKNITLRPEGTAGAVRCYVENNVYKTENMSRWYYTGPMFRAERPQKGRQRQFHQFGIELIGSDSPLCDAEVILANIDFFNNLGLKNLTLKINSVGCEICRPEYLKALKDYFSDKLDNLCEQCKIRYQKNILRILDCKAETCQTILNSAPSLNEHLCGECNKHFDKVKLYLSSKDFVIDKRLVRGLDYYTKTAFEITSSSLGSQDALAGGGRYDNLIKDFCGKKIPAVGSAAGIERLIIALSGSEFFSNINSNLDVFIAYFSEEFIGDALKTQELIRRKNYSCVLSDKAKKIGAQLKDADKLKAKFVMIIGEDEIKSKIFTIKELKTGQQYKLSIDDFVKNLLPVEKIK